MPRKVIAPYLRSRPSPRHDGHGATPACMLWTIWIRWPMLKSQPTPGRRRRTAPTSTSLRDSRVCSGKAKADRSRSGVRRSIRSGRPVGVFTGPRLRWGCASDWSLRALLLVREGFNDVLAGRRHVLERFRRGAAEDLKSMTSESEYAVVKHELRSP